MVEPTIQTTVSLCVSDHLPMSESAAAVKGILSRLVQELIASGRCVGIRMPEGSRV